MTIIVDANIILSAIINPYSPIAQLLFSTNLKVDFVLPEFALQEISIHKNRICEKSNISAKIFGKTLEGILNNLLIFSDELVDSKTSAKAIKLATEIDMKDAIYVSFSLALDALFWTGDLKLFRGLRRKGFDNIITTKELQQIIQGL